MFVLAKTSRSYQGGEGRHTLRYNTIRAAAKAALNDGNPIGFDVYVYVNAYHENCPHTPVMTWAAIQEFKDLL